MKSKLNLVFCHQKEKCVELCFFSSTFAPSFFFLLPYSGLEPVISMLVVYYFSSYHSRSGFSQNVNNDLQWFTVTSTLLHFSVYGKYL